MSNWMRTSLCGAALMLALQSASAADLDIAAGPEDATPLVAGDRAPAFTAYEVDGTPFAFDPERLDRPVVLITFRGGWCPYCNAQLQGLRTVLPEIRAGGVDVLFLSADRPELLYSSLQQETQDAITGLDYHILSDAGLNAASALGIAYRVPSDTLAAYESRGRDMGNSSIARLSALPLPAVFVIDRAGEIVFAYANPDFRIRLPADDVLAAAAPLFD